MASSLYMIGKVIMENLNSLFIAAFLCVCLIHLLVGPGCLSVCLYVWSCISVMYVFKFIFIFESPQTMARRLDQTDSQIDSQTVRYAIGHKSLLLRLRQGCWCWRCRRYRQFSILTLNLKSQAKVGVFTISKRCTKSMAHNTQETDNGDCYVVERGHYNLNTLQFVIISKWYGEESLSLKTRKDNFMAVIDYSNHNANKV